MRRLSRDGKVEGGGRKRGWLTIATVAGSAALIVGIAGAAIYREQVSPFRATVLVVDENAVDMEYFLKRVRLSGQRPLALLPQLAIEEMIKLTAPGPPYDIVVSESDIDAALAEMAGDGATENEIDEWYRQQLNESGFTDAEYRELVRLRLLSRGLADYLAKRVPSVAEQVRLQLIVHDTLDEARDTKARLEAGENFAELAVQRNADEGLKASAGDFGWRPRAALSPVLASTVFDQLEVGEIGGPVVIGGNRFVLVRVVERNDAMAIDPGVLGAMKARALESWATDELDRHHVEYRGFDGGYDSETDAWVMRQIGKRGTASNGTK